jgi:hypothetical protein
MRYYNIVVTPVNGEKQTFSTQYSNGLNNPSALQVDLDIPQSWYYQPQGLGYIRIYGVSFNLISQKTNFNPDYGAGKFAKIEIQVGMSKGLPFSNPAQRGLIIVGSVLQSYANWQGNLVTLDLVVTNSVVNPSSEVNLVLDWKKGTLLEPALKRAIENAYPLTNGVKTQVLGNISPNLVAVQDFPAIYTNIESLNKYLNDKSREIINVRSYAGVSIGAISTGFIITDGTAPAVKTTTVNFQDIIGNLTWINLFTIQAKLTMRGDLNIGNYIIFPRNAPTVNTAASAVTQLRNNVSFQGTFFINRVRHVGNNRQADGDSWVTIVDCIVAFNLPESVVYPI